MEQAFLASGGEFKDCRIGEHFQIGTGSLIDAKELVSGEIKRISVKSDNNGIIGSYQTEGIKQARHFENFISVNFFGGVFYHPYKASVEMKVHTLSLKDHSFTRKTGLYIASLLSKSLSGLFSYGNQLSSSLLASGDFFIKLPYSNGKIAFDFMENFVYELQASRLRELQNYLKVTGLANYELSDEERQIVERFDDLLTNPGGVKLNKINGLNNIEWEEFELGSLFNSIKQGERLTKSDQIAGSLPFVMSGVTDTGVVKYIGNSVTEFPKNSLTIDIFGNVFYRNFEFGASDDVGVYWNSEKEHSKEVMLVLAASIGRALAGKFDYGYKLRSSRSHKLTCHLPAQNGKPDFALMALLGKAIEKLVIADVVKYADREMAAYKKVI